MEKNLHTLIQVPHPKNLILLLTLCQKFTNKTMQMSIEVHMYCHLRQLLNTKMLEINLKNLLMQIYQKKLFLLKDALKDSIYSPIHYVRIYQKEMKSSSQKLNIMRI